MSEQGEVAADPLRAAKPPLQDNPAPQEVHNSDLIDDAEYVLKEIARGEVTAGAATDIAIAAVDALSDAIIAYRTATPPGPKELAAVEKALTKVASIIAPITVQTLRDTDRCAPSKPPGSIAKMMAPIYSGWPFNGHMAEAYRFSDLFFWLTILIVIAALISNYWALNHPVLTGRLATLDIGQFGNIVAPFTFGAMGACVFLLRTLHVHIYGRTFDRRRRPEYFNRTLLGAISGGAIVMLVSEVPQASTAAKISASALGFLAGYNTDLLFSAIERISNAILPKTPDPPPPAKT